MKAIFYMGPGKLSLKKMGIPNVENDIIVKVIEAGICGTDIKTYLHGHHMFKPPVILGHECYGVVVDKPYFFDELSLGDYVVVAPYAECGICETCVKGFPELCKRKTFVGGCFAQYIRVPLKHAFKGLFKVNSPERYFILAEPLACVLNALRKLPQAEEFLIIGGGIMGALFGVYLKSKGKKVRIVEVSEWRIHFLEKLGFDVTSADSLKVERIYDIVIIASTVEKPFEYFELLQDGGYLMLFGGYPKDRIFTINPYHIHYREISVIGSFGYSLSTFASALKELETNGDDFYSNLITHEYSIDDYQEAFDTAVQRKCMKVGLRMWEDEKIQS